MKTIAKRKRRNLLYAMQGGRCLWCGNIMILTQRIHQSGKKRHPNTATLEHIIPLVHGGTNHLDNLAVSCDRCNGERSDKIISPNREVALRLWHAKLHHSWD